MPNKSWIFAVACLLLGGVLSGHSAGEEARFRVDKWTTAEGLPQNEVIAMTQTRDGYLWLGTLDGLARFDGGRFTIFNIVNTPGLNDNQIVNLFEDSRTNLWLGTKNDGVVLIKNGRVTSLGIGRGNREGRHTAVCEDLTGAVWLYTPDGQLSRYRDGKVEVWQMNSGPDRFSNCRAMIAEKSGMVWVGTDSHMFGINPKADLGGVLPAEQLEVQGRLDFLLASERGGYWRLSGGHVEKWRGNRREKDFGLYRWSKPVFTACEDQAGNLVVGTLGDGVWWFDAAGNATQLPSGGTGLSHDYILSLTMDREGSLWVGTDGGGLNRVKRQAFTVLPGTEALAVQSACEDNQGGLWLNSYGGARYWKGGVLKEYGAEQGLANTNGQTIFVDQSQQVWAGSAGSGGAWAPGLFQLRKDRFELAAGYAATNNQEIWAIQQDRQGQVWVGTQGGLARWNGRDWKIFTTRDGLSSDAVQAIAEDIDGSLWLGTGNGLNHFRDGHFTAFHKQDGLPDENISSLYVDAEGVVWIGTRGRGLGRFHEGKWTHYTTSQGLYKNSVGYLVEDGQGNLWLGSPAGLMRVRKQELNNIAHGLTNSFFCRAYGKADGLLSDEATFGSQPGAYRGRDGKLWFPTIQGLVSVDPAQIKFNTNPPPVIIEAVLIGGEPENTNALRSQLPSVVTVPAGREQLEIQYTSLNLAAANKARFRYRMEGYETAWTEAHESRTARYTKLPPGHYRFHVIACNEDEVWNTVGATLAFFVAPPFWRTWWFLTSAVFFLLAFIVAVVHYFSTQRLQRQLEGLRQQQALEKERSRIARDIHDQLGASLTQVSLLGEMVECDKDDPIEVEAHARQISQTARDTARVLDEIVWTVNPSNDTLDGVINYVCKYAQEYLAVAGLRYRLDVPAQLPDAGISPEVRHNVFLAAKEAVTNVVKHAKATEVWVRLRLEPARFILEIQDNGRGPVGMAGKESRNGLRNMHKRMEDVGGSFAITPASEGGTVVRLTVPIIKR